MNLILTHRRLVLLVALAIDLSLIGTVLYFLLD